MTQTGTERKTVDGGLLAPPPMSISVEAIRPLMEALGIVEEDWQRLVSVNVDVEAQRVVMTRHRVTGGTTTRRASDGKRLCETFEVVVTR